MCNKYSPSANVTTEAPTAETPVSDNLRAVSNDDDPRDQLCQIVGKWVFETVSTYQVSTKPSTVRCATSTIPSYPHH